MNIQNQNYNYNINFSARNKEIRVADKIMRKAINAYPAFSTSRATYYSSVQKCPSLINKISLLNRYLHSKRITYQMADNDLLHQVLLGTADIKVANCIEMARIQQAAFLANGYKDVQIVGLDKKVKITKNNKVKEKISDRVDHALLLINGVNRNKKPIVVDSWLGFVDYLDSALTRYDGIFMRGLRNISNGDETTKQRFTLRVYNEKMKLNDNLRNDLINNHPELIINK